MDVLSKTTNGKVNSVHKRALGVLLNDYTSSFEELLHRNEEVTIHEKFVNNLWKRYKNKQSPPTFKHEDKKVSKRVIFIYLGEA